MPLYTGHAATDRYLDQGFDAVNGMSSRFSAAICGHLSNRQTQLGISGSVAEIGVFEGRFFIALASTAAPGERSVAIDPFTWPDPGIRYRFLANCLRYGLNENDIATIASDSTKLTAEDISNAAGDLVRFWHIDGHHTEEALLSDLKLAADTLHPRGLICVDDMLHPHYPMLTTALHQWLAERPDMRALAVIDRVNVIQAAKIVVCKADEIETYRQDLIDNFPGHIWAPGSMWNGYGALVMTQQH